LFRVNVIKRVLRLGIEADVVENKKLRLRAEKRLVRHAAVTQVGLRLLRDVARIARIRLLRDGVHGVRDHAQRRRLAERVHKARLRVRHQQHVRLVDGRPAPDRAAVHPEPFGKALLAEFRNRKTHVLPHARKIGESQVQHLCVVLRRILQYLFRLHSSSPMNFAGIANRTREYNATWSPLQSGREGSSEPNWPANNTKISWAVEKFRGFAADERIKSLKSNKSHRADSELRARRDSGRRDTMEQIGYPVALHSEPGTTLWLIRR